MTQVKKSFNHYIAILTVIALIGILFVPAVSAGKTINYFPTQKTIKTIPVVNYTFNPVVVAPKTIPFTYSPSKGATTILPNPTSDNGGANSSYIPTNYGPIHGMIKTIPAVKYVPTPSSFVPYPQKTLTDSDITCAVCTPIKLELTNNESDYPLFLRAVNVGDIYYLVVDVDSKIKSKVESYFIQVTRAEYCAEDPTTILLGGWVYPDKMYEVSALKGVSMSLMGWPPYGYSDTTLYPPWVSWGVCGNQVT